VKPLYNLKAWAIKEKADYVFNLAFFNMTGVGSDQYGTIKGRTLTYLKAKGYDVGYGGTSEKLTIDANNVCAGYKVGIVNGKAKSVSLTGKRARNANGQLKDGRYFHVQSVTTATEHALVQHMIKNYDVDLLLIQDAGGSTGFYDRKKDVLLAGEREGANGRPVASVVCVKEKAITDRPIVTVKVCPCLRTGDKIMAYITDGRIVKNFLFSGNDEQTGEGRNQAGTDSRSGGVRSNDAGVTGMGGENLPSNIQQTGLDCVELVQDKIL
jgi:hypothetical protein